jgi:acyl-CoA reductase-like NAD-dependent aldehyde dehydrogenase
LLAKGGMYHAGQVCVSVQRVFADRSIAGELAERLAVAADAMVVGDPTSSETDVGPLIREAEATRVGDWVREAGGRIVTGGEGLGSRAYRPTVVLDPKPESKLSREEIFGPVIAVYGTDGIDDAIGRANDVPFSFQAAVFGKNIDAILRATRRLQAAAVMVNDHTAFRVDWMPFAGHRASGLGIGGIPYTMDDMQNEKLVVIRSKEL